MTQKWVIGMVFWTLFWPFLDPFLPPFLTPFDRNHRLLPRFDVPLFDPKLSKKEQKMSDRGLDRYPKRCAGRKRGLGVPPTPTFFRGWVWESIGDRYPSPTHEKKWGWAERRVGRHTVSGNGQGNRNGPIFLKRG